MAHVLFAFERFVRPLFLADVRVRRPRRWPIKNPTVFSAAARNTALVEWQYRTLRSLQSTGSGPFMKDLIHSFNGDEWGSVIFLSIEQGSTQESGMGT